MISTAFMYLNCDITGYIHNFIVTFGAYLSFGILRTGSLQSRDCFIGRRTVRIPDTAFNTNHATQQVFVGHYLVGVGRKDAEPKASDSPDKGEKAMKRFSHYKK